MEKENKMNINKLIISRKESGDYFSEVLINLFVDTGKPITTFFGIDVLVTDEDLGKEGIAFKYPVFSKNNMEVEEVLGLSIEQIAWMKQYFEEHLLNFDPPEEWKKQKMRECFSKQESD